MKTVLGSMTSGSEPSPRPAVHAGALVLGAEAAGPLAELLLHMVGCDWRLSVGQDLAGRRGLPVPPGGAQSLGGGGPAGRRCR